MFQPLKSSVWFPNLFIWFIGAFLKSMEFSSWWYISAFTVAAAFTLWIFFYTWVSFDSTRSEADAEKFKQYRMLSDLEKQELGYRKAAEKLTVRNVRTDATGNYQGESVDDIPVPPAKFTPFVLETLCGKSMTFRNWTGERKPFSDNEFEKMMNKLISLGYVSRGARNTTPEITDNGLKAFFTFANESGRIDLEQLDPDFHDRLAALGLIEKHSDSDIDYPVHSETDIDYPFQID
jgi:hypothetical protein